mgnify:FL=1
MAEQLSSDRGRASSIDKFSVISNKGGDINLSPAISELKYYESIREATVRMTIVYNDSGGSIKGKSVLEALPLVGTEKAQVKIKDNNDNNLDLTL